MNREEILAELQGIARAHLGVTRPITPATALVTGLELDSLRRLTLVVELEDRFRICFDDGDEAGVETVADMVELIARKLGAGREGRPC